MSYRAGVTLSGQAGDATSPLSVFLAGALPGLALMGRKVAPTLAGTETSRPPGLGPPRLYQEYWARVGTAIDYRLRLAIGDDVGSAPGIGMQLLSGQTGAGRLGGWTVF